MPETLAALLLAHVLADFLFQTDWMVANKARPAAMLAHGAVVLVCTLLATGSFALPLWGLALAHVVIDLIKTQSGKTGLTPFLLDQAAHLALIAATAFVWPLLWHGGLWSGLLPATPALLPQGFAVIAGAVAAIRAGGYAVGLLMKPFSDQLPPPVAPDGQDTPTGSPEGLPGAGRLIGELERGLIYLLVLVGQPQGVGLLMAAKSILRFGAVKDDRALSEYVLIGTLASFGWALATGYAAQALLAALAQTP